MHGAPDRHREPADGQEWLERGLTASRWLVIVPVVVLVVAALGAFAYGADVFFGSLPNVLAHPLPVGKRIGDFLLIIDLFLIGATMLIGAIGFYELFIGQLSGRLRMPRWLAMRDLNDLKARVIAMVVLVSAVSFVEVLVDVPKGLEVLEMGGGVGAVILALTVFVRFGDRRAADLEADRGTAADPLVEGIGDRVGDVEEDG